MMFAIVRLTSGLLVHCGVAVGDAVAEGVDVDVTDDVAERAIDVTDAVRDATPADAAGVPGLSSEPHATTLRTSAARAEAVAMMETRHVMMSRGSRSVSLRHGRPGVAAAA